MTGGAGFIGSHLIDALVQRGEDVVVLDDLSTGRRENLARYTGKDRVRLVEGSVLDRELLRPLIARSSMVYHLAAVLGVDRVCRDPVKTLMTNIEGTHTVFGLCREYGVKALLASTSEAFGKNDTAPLSEEQDTVLGPTSVPRWSYAISKLADEHLALASDKEFPTVVVRYFNTYGPRNRPSGYSGVIGVFIDQALRGKPITIYGDGGQTRAFTYIDDAVAATLAAAERGRGEVFNVGRPVETTINELAARVRDLAESNSQIVYRPHPSPWGTFEEPRRRVPDIAKARRQLGFEPQVGLREGLKKTIDWTRALTGESREVA